ncbi:MAG: T9SS type A sorting domain-containing protein [Dysgonamonadaceae bacterium]|nr:T9SS type A sorting domain-containing protein [Dysgonamonadaceae bacterium]
MNRIVLFIVSLMVVCSSASAQLTTQKSRLPGEAALQGSKPQMEVKKNYKAVKPLSVSKNRLNSVRVKETLSTKKLKNGMEFRIVRMENGMISKQIVNPAKQLQQKISPNNKKLGVNANFEAIATAESLFEGFEAWDEEAWDWLPDGWTDESKAGSTSDLSSVNNERYNFTWRTCTGGLYTDPSKGRYCAGVQFAMSFNILNGTDTIEYQPPMPQDEWLISPSVTVKQSDYVFAFDLNYDPFWARVDYYFDEEDGMYFEFNAMHTVVEALISDDGGATWTKKWDNREDAFSYTEDELWDIIGPPWLRVSIDLQEYINKDIKVAIRYWDDGGESVFVDNITVGYFAPDASYRRPEGYLISGLSKDYYALQSNIIIGNAYTPTKWMGKVENQESVSWKFNKNNGDLFQEYNGQNPIVSLPAGTYGYYQTPILTATGKGGATEFQLGIEGEENLMSLGGNNNYVINTEEKLFGVGNYDLQYGFAYDNTLNAEDLAEIGVFTGIANYFEKPAAKYMFETFYVHAGNVTTKPDEPVKLNLYAVNEDYSVGDIIATSETYPEDFILGDNDDGFQYYTIPFKFKVIDPETGLETESYIEMDSNFLAKFYNYESADIFYQYDSHPTGDIYAYADFEEGIIPLGSTSFLFDMDAIFPFLVALNDQPNPGHYAAPDNGGTKEFQISSYWQLEDGGCWLKEELPEWISIGEPVYNAVSSNYTLSVSVAALPVGVTGRNASITLQSWGCEMTLEIKQGDALWSSFNPVNSSKNIKIVSSGDSFQLAYPEGIVSVAVYNVAGQKVGEYALTSSGTFSIPTANLSRGIYILKFAGKTNETVKVVK